MTTLSNIEQDPQTLTDIAGQWDAFEAEIEASGGILTPELEAKYDLLNLSEAEKVTGYHHRIQDLGAVAASHGGKREYYQKLADIEAGHQKYLLGKIEQHKVTLKAYMEARNLKRLEGTHGFGFRLQKDGGKPSVRVLVDPDLLPEAYRKASYAANKEALRTAIEAGVPEAKAVAELAPVGSSVRAF